MWHGTSESRLKMNGFFSFPRGERSARPRRHTHAKSISRWVSGNSSFNCKLSPAAGRRVCRLAMGRLKWHPGKDSPQGCMVARGTISDAGGRRVGNDPFPPVLSQSQLGTGPDQIWLRCRASGAAGASPYSSLNLKLNSNTPAIYHKRT